MFIDMDLSIGAVGDVPAFPLLPRDPRRRCPAACGPDVPGRIGIADNNLSNCASAIAMGSGIGWVAARFGN
jgi:hypothetical protein